MKFSFGSDSMEFEFSGQAKSGTQDVAYAGGGPKMEGCGQKGQGRLREFDTAAAFFYSTIILMPAKVCSISQ
jgi:hypothetical protein